MFTGYTLEWIYRNLFLSKFIREKYLSKFKEYKILGQHFVGTTYVMLIETGERIWID